MTLTIHNFIIGHSDESSVNDILALDILPRIKELIGSDLGDTIKVCYIMLMIKISFKYKYIYIYIY